MYRAFNLAAFYADDEFEAIGVEIRQRTTDRVREGLEIFLEGGRLDATKLGAHWFPEIRADVFISHSHKDEPLALTLAGWLFDQFGVSSFIDSSVWGNSSKLLKQIDDAHCLNPGGKTYSYELRNKSTSHVHMMLATALGKMIDKTECVIFVNTPNSITPSEAVGSKTYSPWIFYELAMMGLVERKSAAEHRPILKEAQFSERVAPPLDEVLVQYDADLDKLSAIDVETLNAWRERSRSLKPKPRFPLDTLYGLVPE